MGSSPSPSVRLQGDEETENLSVFKDLKKWEFSHS